jgi:hypothetical protein
LLLNTISAGKYPLTATSGRPIFLSYNNCSSSEAETRGMKDRNWRNVAELVGMVSIVAGLVLVAWEIRQANNIARAQMVMDINSQANEFNTATYEIPDVADLAAAISNPDYVEYSKTQKSMMRGVAWHFSNIFWVAQIAYDNGLLGEDEIRNYRSSVAWHIENHPGLQPAFIFIYDTAPWIREMYVFEPLVEMVCDTRGDCVDTPADN